VRVTKFGGKWRFQAKVAGDEEWTYYDQPEQADLITLRDIVFRKYQRRRASAEDVQAVDRLFQEFGITHTDSNEQNDTT
jgi:hypothetical protein